MQDNMNNVGFEKVEIDKSEFEEKIGAASIGGADIESDVAVAAKKKRVPVGGIIMGIINIILSIPSFVLFSIDATLLISGIKLTLDAERDLGEGIGLALILIYIIVFTGALLVCAIPPFAFFIVSMFNRSKFFKITAIIIFALVVVMSALALLGVGFIYAANSFGWFTA